MSFERKTYKATFKEAFTDFMVALVLLCTVIWLGYTVCMGYIVYKNRHEDEALRFVTTVEHDERNPCRINVVRKNARESFSYSAVLEGCKQ